jgi:hypothetical protein
MLVENLMLQITPAEEIGDDQPLFGLTSRERAQKSAAPQSSHPIR